jgi:Zn-dependent peptidase ImmA (M78 family)
MYYYFEEDYDEDWVDPDITDYFIDRLTRMCKKLDIQVHWGNLNPYTPPASSPKNKTIAMNNNWHIPEQKPFQMAHEMAHCEHKDDEFAILYFNTDIKDDMEYDANIDAIRLLVRLFADRLDHPEQMDYLKFEKCFGIPNELSCVVREAVATYALN